MITALSLEFWDDISSPLCLQLPDRCTWLLHWKQVLLLKYVDDSYPISKFKVSIFDQPHVLFFILPRKLKPTQNRMTLKAVDQLHLKSQTLKIEVHLLHNNCHVLFHSAS